MNQTVWALEAYDLSEDGGDGLLYKHNQQNELDVMEVSHNPGEEATGCSSGSQKARWRKSCLCWVFGGPVGGVRGRLGPGYYRQLKDRVGGYSVMLSVVLIHH